MITLYSYFRSSAAYRVRIAMNYKGIPYKLESVNLLTNEQESEEYLSINPQGLLPALLTQEGQVIAQSTAILEWLEETYPTPPLLQGDRYARAKIREQLNAIACDIHPLNNLRVLKYLTGTLGADEQQKVRWYQHWIETGLYALEQQISPDSVYSSCSEIGMIDIYLIPQVYNALRFNCDMSAFPNINRVYDNCNTLDAFKNAAPGEQPDCPQ
jgi:maleylacetoacetate isomerase